MMRLSEHAAKRIQQRAIPPLIVQWLREYGCEKHSHGAIRLYFDKDARKRLANDVGHQIVDRLGDLLNVFIVEAADCVITACHRHKRLRRNLK